MESIPPQQSHVMHVAHVSSRSRNGVTRVHTCLQQMKPRMDLHYTNCLSSHVGAQQVYYRMRVHINAKQNKEHLKSIRNLLVVVDAQIDDLGVAGIPMIFVYLQK